MAKAEVKPVTPEWLAPFVEAEIGEHEYRKRRRKKRAEGIEDALITRHLSERFGEGRAELVMQQLIETSLLPAAKAAASGNTGALSRSPK